MPLHSVCLHLEWNGFRSGFSFTFLNLTNQNAFILLDTYVHGQYNPKNRI